VAEVYQRFPLSVVRGRGAILWDASGREYIDCMGGYGVSILGHCHPRIVKAIKNQSEKLITCHGSLYNDKRAELSEKLIEIAPKGLEKVFFSNSGAESVECALKLAAKYTGKKEVVSMVGGYHGKTLGALSATWNQKYRKSFNSFLLPNFRFVPFGNVEKVQEAVGKETAAVMVEPILGETGIKLPPDDFLLNVRKVCNENDVILIFDEVQTGFGRTGRMWASQHWNVVPDIMCLAKGIAGGIPMGATIAKKEIMDSLKVGEHSATFGGNPLACAAACESIDIILEEKLVERAESLGKYLKETLLTIKGKRRIVREVRGLGLMIGLESRFDVYDMLMKSMDKGVILLYSGKNVIRLLPPLVIDKRQLERASLVIEELLEDEERRKIKS
jgi:acetylornithine/LysW-gamma-L-lysine aminotransferase